MSTYTLKSLVVSDDSSMQIEPSEQTAGDQTSFKLVGLKDQNAQQSIVRISHKRHDPNTRIDTKSRVMGGMLETPGARWCVSPVAGYTEAAGQRPDENRELSTRRHEGHDHKRNPVTGEGLTPTEVHNGRTHNIRNKSSITFITSPE